MRNERRVFVRTRSSPHSSSLHASPQAALRAARNPSRSLLVTVREMRPLALVQSSSWIRRGRTCGWRMIRAGTRAVSPFVTATYANFSSS